MVLKSYRDLMVMVCGKQESWRCTLVRAVIVMALSGVGCGGGGGSSSGNSSAEYGVRIVHTAVDAAPMTMMIDGKPLPDYRVAFGEVGRIVELSAGDHTIVVEEVGGGVTRSVPIAVERKERVSVLVTDEGVVAIPLREGTVPPRSAGCAVSCLHGVDGVDTLTFRVGQRPGIAVEPATISSPIVVPQGVQVISVEGEGVRERVVLTCQDDEPLVVAAGGKAGYFVHLAAGG